MTTIDLSDAAPARGRAWVGFALWTAAAVVYALVLHLQVRIPLAYALRSGAVYVYSLAVISLPARHWAARTFGARQPASTRIAMHLGIGVLTIAAWLGANLLSDWLSIGPGFWQLVYANNWLFQILSAATAYGTVIGIAVASASRRRELERERREAALALLARDAELGAIRTQFQPHFVLNALNSLLALIDSDPALARTMVVRLADVMKSVFDRVGDSLAPLERELDLVRAYLDVERIRFGSRLSVVFEIDDAARRVLVPPLLLQPIVENAVKHGIAPFLAPGEVRIGAHVVDGRLHVSVSDTGTGSVLPAEGTGQGLALTRRRLDTEYAGAYELTLDRTARGSRVHISLPANLAHVA